MTIIKYFGNLSTLAKRGLIAALLGSMTAALVSCGGGGASPGTPQQNGGLSILPNTGSLYANVPMTFNIAGGRAPYLVVSNEQTVLPVNFTLSGNTFTAVPNQPGVVDPGSDVNVVPSRTVIITVRDATGTEVTGTYNVLQNFLTGYNLQITTTAECSGAAATTTPTEACAGADSLIRLVPISNGLRYANKTMRLTATFGAFAFILNSTGITGPSVDVVADSAGDINGVRIRVTPNAPTQYAGFRLTDVATGAYRDITFVILNATGGNTALSILPTTLTITGANSASCGTGLFNVFVFGGLPPYTAATTFPNSISVTPPIVTRSGDAFSVQVFNPNVCLSPGNVVFTDATGANVILDITTSAGTTAPVLPLTVSPSALCVPDGGSGVVSISGGNSIKAINSSNPGLAQAVPTTGTGNFTATINSLGAGGALGTVVTFTVSDGGTGATVTVNRKTTCP